MEIYILKLDAARKKIIHTSKLTENCMFEGKEGHSVRQLYTL
jgi:hypothetical protein